MKRILICCKNNFFKEKIKKKNFFFISKKKELNLSFLKKLNPYIIFFPHWSYLVDKMIVKNFLCIGFHSTPLPYGRGGSPIQNMIIRGHKKTKICALKLDEGFDTGKIFIKKNVTLNGSGKEIFIRIYNKIIPMIMQLSNKLPKQKNQVGKIVFFKRRKAIQSQIIKIKNLNRLYDFIRMLDINEKNFPNAYLKNDFFHFAITNVRKLSNKLIGKVTIKKISS